MLPKDNHRPGSASYYRNKDLHQMDRRRLAQRSVSGPIRSSFQQQQQQQQQLRLPKKSQPKQVEESSISVYVRCRTRNEREIKENSGVVVSTTGNRGKEVILHTSHTNNTNKTYTFDRVFGAESDQETVYEGIASGILDEVLRGYNCTVFAYGQTGTGKTYTMSGDIDTSGGHLRDNAGIIPRTLIDLFKHLEGAEEYAVKVSFIELYNEELRDLLSPHYDDDERKVKIFDDSIKKSIKVQGMEEIFIKSPEEGLKLLRDGSIKRQVASTKCNDLSSRSHTVFTITVHVKLPDVLSGEEFMKVGKLNLVDLAGSENINRSGAENKRAREAGMINQSLLTLGRVINALVENSPHIPYRESKLTRLLQDSLGGQTKTCIIATISPAKVSLDETLSTLEYAYRAKSIKNKPQVNQSINKSLLLGEYIEKIERLRKDLEATRSKNGVYLTEENHKLLVDESESRALLARDLEAKVAMLDERVKSLKQKNDEYLESAKRSDMKLRDKSMELDQAVSDVESLRATVETMQAELRGKDEVVAQMTHDSEQLQQRCLTYTSKLQEMANVIRDLSSVIERKTELENKNVTAVSESKESLGHKLSAACDKLDGQIKADLAQAIHNISKKVDDQMNGQSSSISFALDDLLRLAKDINIADDNSHLTRLQEFTDTATSSVLSLAQYGAQHRDMTTQSLGVLSRAVSQTKTTIEEELGKLNENHTTWFSSFDKLFGSLLSVVQDQMAEQGSALSVLQDSLVAQKEKHDQEITAYKNRVAQLEAVAKKREVTELASFQKKVLGLFEEFSSAKQTRDQERAEQDLQYVSSIIATHSGELMEHHDTLNGLKDSTSQFAVSVKDEKARIREKVASMGQLAIESVQQISQSVNKDFAVVRSASDHIAEGLSQVGETIGESTNKTKAGILDMAQATSQLVSEVNSGNVKLQSVCHTHKNNITRSFQSLAKEIVSVGETEVTGAAKRIQGVVTREADSISRTIAKTAVYRDEQRISSFPAALLDDLPSQGEPKRRRVSASDENKENMTHTKDVPARTVPRDRVLKASNR